MAFATNKSLLRGLILAAQTGLIDFAAIGDSNQVKDGTGHDHGFQKAMASRFSMHATGVISISENNESGSNIGYGYRRGTLFGMAGASVPSGAPAAQHAFWNDADWTATDANRHTRHRYSYITSDPGATEAGLTLEGTTVSPSIPGGTSARWRFIWTHINGAGFGSYKPTIRNGTTAAMSEYASAINCAGTPAVVFNQFDAPNGFCTAAQHMRLEVRRTTAITPNICLGLQRAVNRDVSAGWAYTTQGFMGGKHLGHQYTGLSNWSLETWTHWFDMLRRPQLDAGVTTPRLVFIIQSGLNDVNGTSDLSANGSDMSATRAGFKANMIGIVDMIRDTYEAIYGNFDGVSFLISRSHKVADSAADDQWAKELQMVQYGEACAELARAYPEYIAAFDPSVLMTKAEFVAGDGGGSWFLSSGTDEDHMGPVATGKGYEVIWERVIEEILSSGRRSRNRQGSTRSSLRGRGRQAA